MCAIIGMVCDTFGEAERSTLVSLMEQSRIRGLHAFGLAWTSHDGTLVVERFLDFQRAQQRVWDLDKPDQGPIVFHARYSTSGDFKVLENNQPIRLGGTALAFNGVLHMGTKSEMEAELGEPMETDNDGEMFLRRMRRGEDPAGIVRSGSFSGVWIEDGLLCALSNGRRPAWVFSNGTVRIVLSTRDIAIRAGLGSWEHGPLAINQVTRIHP